MSKRWVATWTEKITYSAIITTEDNDDPREWSFPDRAEAALKAWAKGEDQEWSDGVDNLTIDEVDEDEETA